jgi:hypothetical protein
MDRFKMNFSNTKNDDRLVNYLMAKRSMQTTMPTNTKLNSSMIDRIYKAKPGCSACGKKGM